MASIRTTIWIPKELRKELRIRAAIEEKSVSQLICQVMREYLEQKKREEERK